MHIHTCELHVIQHKIHVYPERFDFFQVGSILANSTIISQEGVHHQGNLQLIMISRTFARTVTNSFRTSVPKGCANPGLLRSSTFQSSLFRSSQIQNTISQKRTISFKRIEVSSTLGVRLLRLSKTLGLAILVVYAIGGSAFTFLYVKETTKSDSAQKYLMTGHLNLNPW